MSVIYKFLNVLYFGFILIIFPCFNLNAQVVFEINEPLHLKGVYPCMIPKNDWTGLADVSANFYSDTIVVANDGIVGSACGMLQSNLAGNFAIFRRKSCSFDQQLLNVQNAGATGAIIIDSVVGRPLPFDAFGLSDQITIPFIIVSKDEGDSLINATQQGEICQVAFGNKKDVYPNDIGIYKEKALWSSYGYYRLYNGDHFTDTTVGTWVFNNGTNNVTNLQLKFFIQGQLSGIYDEVISAYFDLNSHDSVFIELPYLATTMDYSNEVSGVDYGYEIIGSLNDEDTLDNRISMPLYFKTLDISLGYLYDVCSPSYFNNQTGNNENDFYFDLGVHSLTLSFFREFPACIYDVTVKTNGTIDYTSILDLSNYQLSPITFYDSFPTIEVGNSYWGHYELWDLQNEFMDFYEISPIAEINEIGIYFEFINGGLYFTTDMYHDERYKQYPEKKLLFFDEIGYKPLNYSLTPCMFFLQPARNSNASCFTRLSENMQSTVNIFPNPTNGEFEVRADYEIKNLEIISVDGRICDFEVLKNKNIVIKTIGTQNGIYFINFEFDNGQRYSRKIEIINK